MSCSRRLVHKRKVFAYITRGEALLVNRHVDFPDAGIQVPAGTVEPEELLVDALFREVFEETGLGRDVFTRHITFLGEAHVLRELPDVSQLHHRHFYRLTVEPGRELPDRWMHTEMYCDDGHEPVVLEHFWCSIDEASGILWPGFGKFLGASSITS